MTVSGLSRQVYAYCVFGLDTSCVSIYIVICQQDIYMYIYVPSLLSCWCLSAFVFVFVHAGPRVTLL